MGPLEDIDTWTDRPEAKHPVPQTKATGPGGNQSGRFGVLRSMNGPTTRSTLTKLKVVASVGEALFS